MTLDRAALQGLFDYTTFTWEAYGKAIGRLPGDALTRPVGGSEWPALRNVLFHVATAWDGWLRDRLGLDDSLDATPDSVASWADLDTHRRKTRSWLRQVIDQASDSELQARTERMGAGTPGEMSVTVGEVLAHILLHERGHHGDVTTLLSQLGATPPSIDYLTYVFFQQQAKS